MLILAILAALILTALLVIRVRAVRQQRLHSVLVVTEPQTTRLAQLEDRYEQLMRNSRALRGDIGMRLPYLM